MLLALLTHLALNSEAADHFPVLQSIRRYVEGVTFLVLSRRRQKLTEIRTQDKYFPGKLEIFFCFL